MTDPSWRHVLRTAWLPMLSSDTIRSLALAFDREMAHGEDDGQPFGSPAGTPRIIQGATTVPPLAIQCIADWPVEVCCLIGYAGWIDGCKTVGEVNEYFARTSGEINNRIGEPAIRWLIAPFDELPRSEIYPAVAAELRAELARREEPIPF